MNVVLFYFLSYFPLVAFLAVQISGISPILTIIKKKDTGYYSPFPFVSMFVNCILWSLYGFLTNALTVLIANFAGTIAGLVYTLIYTYYVYKFSIMLKYYVVSLLLLSIILTTPLYVSNQHNAYLLLGIYGNITGIVLSSSPMAVIKTVIHEKSTRSMPFLVTLSIFINAISWILYGLIIANDYLVWIPNVIALIIASFQLSLYLIYPYNNSGIKELEMPVGNEKQPKTNQISDVPAVSV